MALSDDLHTILSDLGARWDLAECRESHGEGPLDRVRFGDLSAELTAADTSAVMIPLEGFVRIQVRGKDRVRFLHNFCTNDIRSLVSGQLCEVFFTDVKARILANGWILAGDTVHEIWMLPGDETSLLKHLNKYLITEDVTFQSLSAETATLACLGPLACQQLSEADPAISYPPADNTGLQTVDQLTEVVTTVIRIPFAENSLLLFSLPISQLTKLWQSLSAAKFTPAGCLVFERFRILEGYPIFGVDITTEHMAPEADRNVRAISYTKGCYLGQEPIARLDAMGHINRAVRRISVNASPEDCQNAAIRHSRSGELGKITSVAPQPESNSALALAVIRVHGIDFSGDLTVHNAEGHDFIARLLPKA